MMRQAHLKAVAMDPEDPKPTTLAESAYRRLREDVLCGVIKPGEKIRIDQLAERYQMGTSPIRECMSRLAAEGLLVAEGQRGYWVALVSREDFRDITDLRVSFETQALALSIDHGDIAWESEVVASFHRLSRIDKHLPERFDLGSDWERENRAYHAALISRCPSKWLLRFTSTLYDQSERYRRGSIAKQPIPGTIVQRAHKSIMDAALGRDKDKACAALAKHIETAARQVEKNLFPRIGPGEPQDGQ